MEKTKPIEGLGYIYRYLFNGTTVYVGQTINLDKRIQAHSNEIKFFGLTDIEFKGCKRENLNDIEAYYIKLYKPVLNKVYPKIKNENIENNISISMPWEKYKKPVQIVFPLVKFDDIEQAFSSFKSVRNSDGTVYYGFGFPMDPEVFPTSIDYYTFGTGKNKFECVLLEDYNKCMTKISDNFLRMVSEKAHECAEDLIKLKGLKINE